MEKPLSRRSAHALLHFTVLLWGLTALLGKSIQLSALPLVFYRVVLVAALMAVILWRRGIGFAVPVRRAALLGAAGVLVAAHWVLFYAAVKAAGVSVAVLCLSSITFFTALLEPLFFRRRVRLHELALGGLVTVGVVLLLRIEVHASVKGWAMGIGSALFSAAFGTWNGVLAQQERPERVTLYELAAAGIVCGLAFLPAGGFVPPWDVGLRDWALLGFLAVACTLMPWLWSLRILRTLPPYTVALSVSLEPVYSIMLAYLLWPQEERLSVRFYAGTGLLLAIIVTNGVLKGRAAAVPS